jgi:acetyl esterase
MPESRRRSLDLLGRARTSLDAVNALVLPRIMAQPASRLRALAGPPVRVDGHELSVQAQLMLRLMGAMREKGAEEYADVARGREAMRRQAVTAGGRHPIGEVHDRTVRGAAGPLPARLYVPRGASAPGPLLVFFHGGGMVYGDLESHDALCRVLAEEASVRVLSVDYRLAPEHVFPAGVEDAWAAYEWVASNAADYDADPARLAVGGDSAGGYLAAATALRAAAEQVPLAFQLLIYPMTEMFSPRPSRSRFGEGFYLTAAFMERAETAYLAGSDRRDPRASVLHADLSKDVVSRLAPGYLVTAGFDPLRDEGEAYATRLQDAGVELEYHLAAGEIHGFANMLGWEGSASGHLRRAARALKAGLAG